MPSVVVAQEVTDRLLRHDVQTDRRLVEEQHARPVQQRRDQLHFHPLAQGKLAYHDVELRPDIQERDQFVQGAFEGVRGNGVDRAQEVEGLHRR